MKPIIGITPNYSEQRCEFCVHEDYIHAITRAGGIPVLLFPDGGIPSLIDGIMLTGGGDIDPLLFGEEPLIQSGEISPLRDASELALCKEAFERDLPIFGICRGTQIINIVTGGGLYQDIFVQTGTTLKHVQQAPRHYGTHSVFVEEGTKLSQLWGKESIRVNSMHHQSISIPGEGFVVAARSADGLAEAIEHREKPFVVGVQWHPESMKDSYQEMLFDEFVRAAAAFQKEKEGE